MSAELQSPQGQQQLIATTNFAPTRPLLELKRGGKSPASYIAKALQKKFAHFHKKNAAPFREIANVGQLISLFFNGQQYPIRNPIDGSWGVLPITGGGNDSSRRALNVMNNLKQNLLTKWENSNPDILIRPGRNLDICASAAKSADAINNYYERQFYNHWFSQQEGLMGMTFGTYIDRYRFDDSKVSMSVLQDVFETKPVTMGEGAGMCGDCEFGGAASEFQGGLAGEGPMAQPHCPNCLSTAVTVTPPATDDIHSMSGQQQHQIGDLVCELLPMPACRWDLARRPEESSWFIYRQMIPKGSITRVLGNVLLPQGEGEHDHGLEVLRALQNAGQALGGSSGYGNQRRDNDSDAKGDEVSFDEMWLGPDDIADINLIGDEETLSGEKLPKGKLVDHFPDGLCAVGLNGMAVVLALYAEKHGDHIVSGTWFTQAQTGSGRGLADSVEVQKQFNTMNNQARTYMSATYTPAIGYDNQIWTGSKMKYLGDPHTNIPFDLTKLPEGRKLQDSIYQFQPTAMPGQFFDYAQNFLNVMFQKTSMVTDFSQGEPGITASNTTATAAEIDQGNADSINQPIFMIKADARKRGAELTIKLFREHFPMKRYFDLGGRYGQVQGVELSGADLKADLVFEVARNSEMPKGPFQKQKNRMQFFNVLGGAEGYLAMRGADPKLTNQLEQEFDVDTETDDYDSVAEICRRRLDQMKQSLQGGVTDPNIIVQEVQPPVDVAELKLSEKSKWFAEALDWDEVTEGPPALREAVSLMARGMFQGDVMQRAQIATGAGIVQAAGAVPGALGQKLMEDGQDEQQPPPVDPNNELKAAADAQTQQAGAAESEAQRKHEAEQGSATRAHELKTKAIDGKLKDKEHANKVKLAKMKPKVAVKGKAK